MGKAKDDFGRAAGSGTDKRRRSGSEKRRRGKLRAIRFTPEEDQRIVEMEKTSGLSFAGLMRHALFSVTPPRGSRRLSADREVAADILAALGKIGSNVNQIAKHANMGREDLDIPELKMALRDLAELRLACLQALGYEREYGDHEP